MVRRMGARNGWAKSVTEERASTEEEMRRPQRLESAPDIKPPVCEPPAGHQRDA